MLRFLWIGSLFLVVQCATAPQTVDSTPKDQKTASNPTTPETPAPEPASNAELENSPGALERATIEDIIRIEEPNTKTLYDNSHYDFPITINSAVEGWIDYFAGRGREHMERYLSRSSRYIPSMRKVLKEEGLPEDLVYLALIESGFNLRARSRARAVGPWQFIKSTGARYGLRIDPWVDERRDPLHSTHAAAKYLKDLYLMFESWYLAAAAYNAGEYKILRAVEALKTNNFWAIVASKKIRRETKDYVPKLIAAAIIAKNPERYGFKGLEYEEPLVFETVVVRSPIHLKELSKLVNAPVDVLEELNPELTQSMVPSGVEDYELRVHVGSKVLVERAVSSVGSRLTSTDIPKEHVVRRGETIYTIARLYGLSANNLMNFNNVSKREKLSPGSRVLLPIGSTPRVRQPAAHHTRPETAKGPLTTHRVRSGDSLWSIALQYDVTVQDLFRWNRLNQSRIFPGMVINIHPNKQASVDPEARAPAEGNIVDDGDEPIDSAKPDAKGFVMHTVQPGESLWSISKDYDVSVGDIRRWNGLRRSRIFAGKKLRIRSVDKSSVSSRESKNTRRKKVHAS